MEEGVSKLRPEEQIRVSQTKGGKLKDKTFLAREQHL